MTRDRVRFGMIALIAVAAVLSVVAQKLNKPWIGQIAFVAFFGAVVLYVAWRRQVAARRRTMVLDSESQTDETRTRTDEQHGR
jgi:membrane protein implicated in regulation of membrane protease activity